MAYIEDRPPELTYLLLELSEWETVQGRLTHDTKLRLGSWTEGPLGVGFIFLLTSKDSIIAELTSLGMAISTRE